MNDIHKIGIITSGGDCGGLNAVIKGAANMANYLGIDAVVIPNGYAGLYNLIDFSIDELVILDTNRLHLFSVMLAGSEAGHTRVKISKIIDPNKYERIKNGLKKHNISALIVSGGDDSGDVVVDLNNHGIPTNHAPKTMDLDLQTYSVGGDSTINAIANELEMLKTTAQSHNRIIILEVFGRYAGHSAFRAGIAADADCIIIPEVTPNFDIIYEDVRKRFMERVENSDVKAGYYMIITSEAMKGDATRDEIDDQGFLVDKSVKADAFGHYPLAGAGKKIETELKKRMKDDPKIKEFMKETHMYVEEQNEAIEIRVIRPTHLVRSGNTTAYDVNFGKEVGAGAVLLLNQGIYGITAAGYNNGTLEYMSTKKAIQQRYVNLEMITLHEILGTCFGRKAQKYELKNYKETKTPQRAF